MAYSIWSLFLRIGRDVVARLKKPTKDNWWAVAFVALGLVGSAHSHHWSWQAMWTNAWDTLVLPWGLGLCSVFVLRIGQSARIVYREERVSFQNALGGITKQPPWHFRWRWYSVVAISLCLPIGASYWIWQKSNPEEEPLLYLQPDIISNDKGVFALHLQNSGPDIEYVGVHYDYFVAEKKDNDLSIYRTMQYEELPSPSARPLRTNQSQLVRLSFSGDITSIYQSLASSSKNYTVLEGVRLIVTVRRYIDGKNYKKVWSYACNRPVCDIIYAPGSVFDQDGPPGMTILSLHELTPYMESNEHWIEPVVERPSYEIKGGTPLS
jgi:hypothetical protein